MSRKTNTGKKPEAIRDRIRELRRVPAHTLLPHPQNWRRHPERQKSLLLSSLSQLGYADALIARETPEGLQLLDGHLRAETTPEATVPVLIVDLDDQEATTLLASLDPLAALAETDSELLRALVVESTAPLDLKTWLLDEAAFLDLPALGAGEKPETTTPDYADRTTKRLTLFYSTEEYDLICARLDKAGRSLGTDTHSDTVRVLLEARDCSPSSFDREVSPRQTAE